MAQQAAMRLPVKHDVLVDFIRNQQAASVTHDAGECLEIIGQQDRARRIVRKV